MSIIKRIVAWVAVAAMPGAAWGLGLTALALWDGRGPVWVVEDLVALAAAVAGAVVATYLTVTGAAMMVGAAVRRGRSIPQAVSAFAPASWQRVTATALGLTMSAGLAAPALAATPPAPHVGWTDSVVTSAGALSPPAETTSPVGWTTPGDEVRHGHGNASLTVGFAPAPHATGVAPHALATSAPPSDDESAASAATYTVRQGDSLWRITAKLLGPSASDASINKAWPALYAANEEAVGSDPALIHPGLVLTIPQGLTS